MLVRLKAALVVGLVLAHLAASWLAYEPGYLSIDELTYHKMAQAWVEQGTLFYQNGYEEFPSAELIPGTVKLAERTGRLAPRFPYLGAVLGGTLYAGFGQAGMVACNVLAWVATLALIFLLGRRLAGAGLGLDACMVFIGASYAWHYSQGTWPQMTAAGLTLLAQYLYVCAWDGTGWRSWALNAGAGLLVGIGMGLRLDVLFIAPTLFLPSLLRRPWRPGAAAAFALGALPGIALLAWTNLLKFDVFDPLYYGQYGTSWTSNLPALAGALGLVAVVWLRAQSDLWQKILSRGPWMAGATLFLLLLGGAAWAFSDTLDSMARRMCSALIDFRIRPLEYPNRGGLRTESGGLYYLDALKKSWLQSLPYLPMLLLPGLGLLRRKETDGRWLVLLSAPVLMFGLAYFRWHCGMGLDLRYGLPALPIIALLAARGMHMLALPARRRWLPWGLGLLLVPVYLFGLRGFGSGGVDALFTEQVHLTLPLLLAGALTLACLYVGSREAGPGARTLAACLCALGLVWAGLVAYTYDLPAIARHRAYNRQVARIAAPLIEGRALVFSNFVDPLGLLIEREETLHIADPALDGYRELRGLVDAHLDAGYNVYGLLGPKRWVTLAEEGVLTPDRHRVTELRVFPHRAVLMRVERAPD